MKKLLAIALSLMLVLGLTACGSSGTNTAGEVSVFYYTYSDTYISSVRAAMDKMLTSAGYKFNNYDGGGNGKSWTSGAQTGGAWDRSRRR